MINKKNKKKYNNKKYKISIFRNKFYSQLNSKKIIIKNNNKIHF